MTTARELPWTNMRPNEGCRLRIACLQLQTRTPCHPFEHHAMIDSDCESCRQVQDDVVQLAELHQFTQRDLFAIRLALEEALANAVKHGNGSDPCKQVHIDYIVNSREVRVRIEDEGVGFQPDQVPNPTAPEFIERPGGRGLLLMRQYMCGVRFSDRGNCVEMWKLNAHVATSEQQPA